MLAFADVFGALKHHVFKEMREAGVAGLFIAGAYVIRDGDGKSGRGMIFREDDAQSVFEFEFLESYFISGGGEEGCPEKED